ncbi:MAG: NUDIX hydrolase [Candidatus Kerfeldbacteria bacterium]|nr:NUDIX hydrolase [Candidatus Kerfeldbacteria bacterium]
MSVTPWKRLSSKVVFTTPWFSIRQDTCQLPDASVIDDYYVAQRPDAVCIFALTEDNRAIVNTQYKHGIGKVCREFPAGMIDTNEDPLHAAQRELEEETGYRAKEWISLGKLIVSPTSANNYDHVFLALECTPTGVQLNDAREEIEHELVSVSQLVKNVYVGELNIIWVISAVHLALPHLVKRGIIDRI